MKRFTLKIKKPKERVTWGFSPVSRVVKSKKVYSRKKFKLDNY
jgi:hypothetical protein